MEPVSVGAAMAVALGLVKVVEMLVTKLVSKKEEATDDRDPCSGLIRIENGIAKIETRLDVFSENMARISASQERVVQTLDRIETRLAERDQLELMEMKLKSVKGDRS